MDKIIIAVVLALGLQACGPQESDKTAQTASQAAPQTRQDADSPVIAFYNCGELGIKAVYTGQDKIVLSALDEEHELPRVVSASGAKYETPDNIEPHIVFWSKGREAYLTVDGQDAPTCIQIMTEKNDTQSYSAKGNEPFWRIEMNETEVVFQPMDGDTVTWPRPQADLQNGLRVYNLSTDQQAQRAVLTIDPMAQDKPCQDSMSGQYYPDAVRFDWNNQIFSGCGGPVDPKTQDKKKESLVLHGREWILEDLNKTGVIDNAQLTLTFDAKDGRLYGSGGCNRYFGNYTLEGDELKIHPALGATMMACIAEAMMNQERVYLDLLPKMTKAEITPEGWLILSGDKGETMRFTARD